jgi:hypothetical protein
VDAGGLGSVVGEPGNRDGTEDRQHLPSVAPPLTVTTPAPSATVVHCDLDSGAHVAEASSLHVRLEQQSLNLSPSLLLLALDVVEGRGQCLGGHDPALKFEEGRTGLLQRRGVRYNSGKPSGGTHGSVPRGCEPEEPTSSRVDRLFLCPLLPGLR